MRYARAACCALNIHLIDGTYELFRHYYALPSAKDQQGCEVAAVRGVLASVLGMLREGATHVAVATDHIIESFRNDLWPGYKTGEGIDPDLLAQFVLLEETLTAAGVVVWPMVEFEADDALAAAALAAAADVRVERVIICTPDKDLAQCVRGTRVVQLNRRTRVISDEAGVIQKFGVPPASIPDYLALVGDAADGYPGLPGWGAKSAAAVLAKFEHLEKIPTDWREWHVNASSPGALAHTLSSERERAMLFRTLATLRTDIPLFADVDELLWNGPTDAFPALGARFDAAVTAAKESSRAMSKRSAGLLLFRETAVGVEVLLAHPGGPFWAKKDEGAWSVPKGEIAEGEDALAAAKREFEEEIGFRPTGEFVALESLKQPGGKLVFAWGIRGDFDPAKLKSNSFSAEWPPKSGRQQEFPEVDRVAWLSLESARQKILKGQAPFLDRLSKILAS